MPKAQPPQAVALAPSVELLQGIIDEVPIGIFWKDRDSRFLGCNSVVIRHANLASQADFIGKTDSDMPWKAQAELYRADDKLVMQSGIPKLGYEEPFTATDGSQRWLRTSKVPLRDKNNAIVGILGIYEDITEQKAWADMLARDAEQRRQHELEYREIIQASFDGYWVVRVADAYIIDANDAFCRMVGYTRDELLTMRIPDLEALESAEDTAAHIRKLIETGHDIFETRHRHKDGHLIDFEISCRYLDIRGGMIYVFTRDITERKKVEQELHIAATAFEAQEGIVITDSEERIVRVNRAFTRITGYTAEEVLGRKPSILKSNRHDSAFYRQMHMTLNAEGVWSGEIWDCHKDGHEYPKWLTITAVKDRQGRVTHYVGNFSDITERKRVEDLIHHLAFYDTLTDLPNRRLLLDRLEQALAASARSGHYGALLFLDLDNFKTLNDTKGHQYGDMLLKEVASRLRSCLREEDTIARLGGDEFVAMLENLDPRPSRAALQAKQTGDKLIAVLGEPYVLGDSVHHASCSIGIAPFIGSEDELDPLLIKADTAMYQAKKAGKNTLRFFDPAMQAELEKRVAFESALRQALPHGQFRLYYQMQVDAQGRPIGAEGLIRWQHPELGLVAPADFIPAAEEMHQIDAIGRWVLATACAQLKAWESHPQLSELSIAVNVSAFQLRASDFVDNVLDIVASSGVDPAKLKLELTESMVLDDVEDSIAKMHRLKASGIQLAMDDFGTGYSSLAYLKQLPFNQIKIDRSFITRAHADPNDAFIVLMVYTMGRLLNMEVIAEGVETQEQFEMLTDLGCRKFQGYLFGRPMPAEELEAALHAMQPA